MKTYTFLKSGVAKNMLIFAATSLLLNNVSLFSQEVQTVFSSDNPTRFVWGLEAKTARVQKEYGTLCGAYIGAMFNSSVMAGVVGSLNMTHPSVNYGYVGLTVRYIYKPYSVIHLSGQLTLGKGSTKDYENEKSSLFDNFGNVYGASYYFIEPSANVDINLGEKTTLIIGLGYRHTTGMDPDSRYVSATHLSSKDLSGLTINVGAQFSLK